MKRIPILKIDQFEQKEPLEDFYSNALDKHLERNKQIIHKPHRHNFFLCVLFIEGSGIHEIDFNSYAIQSGSVFFLRPGQTHYWKFDGPVKGYIFFHTASFYEFYFVNIKLTQFPFYYSFKNPPTLTLSKDGCDDIVTFFRTMNTEYHQQKALRKQKLASLVNIVYVELTRVYVDMDPIANEITSSTYLKTLEALETFVETFYKTEKSARFYANKLNITAKHLNRITRATLNKTTTELITERVLLEAKRLIVHSENSLTAIAEILGYEDYAYFSKLFKLKTKTTPIQFKKGYR